MELLFLTIIADEWTACLKDYGDSLRRRIKDWVTLIEYHLAKSAKKKLEKIEQILSHLKSFEAQLLEVMLSNQAKVTSRERLLKINEEMDKIRFPTVIYDALTEQSPLIFNIPNDVVIQSIVKEAEMVLKKKGAVNPAEAKKAKGGNGLKGVVNLTRAKEAEQKNLAGRTHSQLQIWWN